MKTLVLLLVSAATAAQAQDVKDIVDIAAGSKDHKTLVAALKAADYVMSLKNPGPLTVFAPTDAAFAKLPAGTLETLLKPENQGQLQKILQYHVTPATYETKWLKEGQTLGQANGQKVKIGVSGTKVTVNGANVLASVRASNGIVHVIDAVLLPAAPDKRP
ncbi:MAG: fasciclin domain-containing protein [Myxococcaceae bacterium]